MATVFLLFNIIVIMLDGIKKTVKAATHEGIFAGNDFRERLRDQFPSSEMTKIYSQGIFGSGKIPC